MVVLLVAAVVVEAAPAVAAVVPLVPRAVPRSSL